MRINFHLEIVRSRARNERALDLLALVPSLLSAWNSMFPRHAEPSEELFRWPCCNGAIAAGHQVGCPVDSAQRKPNGNGAKHTL